MTVFQYFQRPHLLIAILAAAIVFLLLTLAAANMIFEEEPAKDFIHPTIATETVTPTEK